MRGKKSDERKVNLGGFAEIREEKNTRVRAMPEKCFPHHTRRGNTR